MLDVLGLSALLAWPKRLQRSQLLITVFDLPELNNIILSHLSRNDLVRWARVSKKWHYAVIPYIWQDMSALTKPQYKRLAKMVMDDYQRVHSHPTKMTGSRQSALPKYCPLIRKLGLVSGRINTIDSFLLGFILRDVMQEGAPLSDAQQAIAQSIFHHFMVHCTHLDALDFRLGHERFHESVIVIADSSIQHLRHLSINGTILQCAFGYMLARLPATLETLDLRFQLNISSKYQLAMNEAEQEPLSNLRRLTLRKIDYFRDPTLPALWKRCESVEELDLIGCWIGGFNHSEANTIATVLETFPNLNAISIEEIYSRFSAKDEDSARLLSTSRQGWKSVSIMGFVEFGELSWEALSQHTSTFESFTMVKPCYRVVVEMRPFFTSFPRLRSFVTLAEREEESLKINSIGAADWIHLDPLSSSLIPWPCEHTLTDLRISISGIPRPDVTYDDNGKRRHPTVEESYPGEGREIQHRVYERLARFVNLEVLWLGSNSYYHEDPDRYLRKVLNYQFECLEMSLESGLDQLEGLKRLKVLNISLMATRIGQKEAQWMTEQWPRLREIRGLEYRDGGWRAIQWFKRNSPRIATR